MIRDGRKYEGEATELLESMTRTGGELSRELLVQVILFYEAHLCGVDYFLPREFVIVYRVDPLVNTVYDAGL